MLAVVVAAITSILHFAVAVRTTRTISIASIIVAITAIVPTDGRIVPWPVTTGRGASATRRTTTITITTGVEAPGCRRRRTRPLQKACKITQKKPPWTETYFDLEGLVATYTLVMHFVVGIIGVATTLVFHEGKAVLNEMHAENRI